MKAGIPTALLAVLVLAGCSQPSQNISEPTRTIPTGKPQELNYENMSLLLEDMQRYTQALRPLNLDAARRINDRYTNVLFQTRQKPLFVNVYPDLQFSRVVFLISPNDPRTGTTYLLQYDKKLPVVNASTLELQIRTRNPEEPLTCLMDHPDPSAYLDEIGSHLFTVRFELRKMFLQSGTFDFDGLTIESYRRRGYPFVVFDLKKTELTDTTAKVTFECRQGI